MSNLVRTVVKRGLFWVVLVPLLVNVPIIFGYFATDSMTRYSGLAKNITGGLMPGVPLEDPSMAFTYEPNAEQAVMQILGGHLPWWNSLEGTGMPLAGEMQSAAFSIFSPMLFLRNGQALINLVVELLSGIGLYLLLRRLRFTDFSAAIGAIAYSLNGSFAWLGAETFYAVGFMPLLLYRLECLRDRDEPRLGSWLWIALLVALPVTCGFPETVYFDDLFIVAWVAIRCIGLERRPALIWAGNGAIGGALGVLLVSPLLIAFLDFLHVAYLGEHAGSFGDKTLPHEAALQTLVPYVWGPISAYVDAGPLAQIQQTWPNVGGFLSVASVSIAALGLAGGRLRPLRIFAAAWLVVFVLAGLGVPPFHALVVSVPGAKYTSYFRYCPPTWELCTDFLIACALDDARGSIRKPGWRLVASICFCMLVVVLALGLADAADFAALFAIPQYLGWFGFSCVATIASTAIVFISMRLKNGHTRAWILGSLVVVEASAYLVIPMLANFRSVTLDRSGTDYVKARLGLQRVYTLGRLSPNTGSALGIAQITYNDAPIPKNLYDFVANELDQTVYPVLFTGNEVSAPGLPTRIDMLRRNLKNFAKAGVAYVLSTSHGGSELYDIGTEGPGSQPLDVGVKNPVRVHAAVVDTTGYVRTVSLLQGNYGNTANGDLGVRICTRVACSKGHRALAESIDDRYFEITLDRPLFIDREPVDIDVNSSGSKAVAMWTFDNEGTPAMTITRPGSDVRNRHVAIRLAMGSFTYTNPISPSGNVPYNLVSGEPVVSEMTEMPDGEVAHVSVLIGNYNGKADGQMRLEVCSDHRCERAVRDIKSSSDDKMFDFPLPHPVRVVNGRVTLRLATAGAKQPPAIWLFPTIPLSTQSITDYKGAIIPGRSLQTTFVYTAGFGLESIYDDELMSVYRVTGARPYFDAPGCTIAAHNRQTFDAFCRAPAKLVRLETFMPGWHASVNGSPVEPVLEAPLFQSISLSAGRSTVTFAFEPPYVKVGYALLLFALLVLAADAWVAKRRYRLRIEK